MEELFTKAARRVERAVGSPWAFLVACASVLVWGATGPLFGYSDTWQLVINTSTTVVTYLIVFLIQATQTRDTLAIHIKLDELLRAIATARTAVASAEELSSDELDRLHGELRQAAEQARREE